MRREEREREGDRESLDQYSVSFSYCAGYLSQVKDIWVFSSVKQL